MGQSFYKDFLPFLREMMEKCGVNTLEATVGQQHFEYLKKVVEIENLGPARMAGRDMVLVRLTKPLA